MVSLVAVGHCPYCQISNFQFSYQRDGPQKNFGIFFPIVFLMWSWDDQCFHNNFSE